MSRAHFPKPHHPNNDVPEEFEPGAPPVEPDQGPVLPLIPDAPQQDRVTGPGAKAPGSAGTTAEAPDPLMVQAKRDIDGGLVDTDMHATPGLDAQLRARLVPGPGGKPPPKGV